MDYERWIPVIYLLFGAASLVNGLFSFQNNGPTLETILLVVGGSLMIALTASVLLRSDGWSFPEPTDRMMFYGGLLGLVLYVTGSAFSAVG
jgi:hypothetical protein